MKNASRHCCPPKMSTGILRSTVLLAMLAFGAFFSTGASAIPSIFDHWHFFCSPTSQVTNKQLASAKSRASGSGSKGAIARFNYACMLHMYEIRQHQAALEKWQAGGGKGAQPQLNHNMSVGVLRQASSALANLSKGSKKDPRVLYYYGYSLALLGDVSAVNRLDELMTEFPSSSVVSDAALVLGEFYFDNKDPQKAFREYAKTSKSKKTSVQLYTRYKQAWITYALGMEGKDQNKKRRAITDLVNITKVAKGKKGRIYNKMNDQVKTDLMTLLADYGNLDEARRILASVGAKDVSATLVEQMAYARLNAGDIKGAYTLFQTAVKEDPLRPEAPTISSNLVRLSGQMNNIGLVVANLKLMVDTYIKDKKWRSVQKAPLLKKTDADIEALLYEFATIIDRQGRETNDLNFLKSAVQLYALFGKTFPKSPKNEELRYYTAQIQLQLKQYAQAARMLYTILLKNPKFPQAKEASELMVTAAQLVMDNDKTAYKVPEPGTPLSPQKIPPNKKLYAECLELFLKFQPRNELAPTMEFTVASVYYDYGHFDKAIKGYYTFIRRHPGNQFAKPAAARILIYHQRQFDDEGLAKAKATFLAVPTFKADPEMVATIQATDTIENQNKRKKEAGIAAKAANRKKAASGLSGEQPSVEGQGDESSSQEETDEAIEASTPQDEE